MPVDPTRRRFLSNAAGVAAGGTVLAMAAIPPAPASSAPAGLAANPDPVFAMIEKHKAAEAALYDDILADGAYSAEISALHDLIEDVPTTLAGVIASMTYIGCLPHIDCRIGADEIVPLLASLAEALEGLAVAS
jgi:hypothetical protein